MPSLEAKLAAAATEVQNLRQALEKEVQERRRDHDTIIAQKEQIKTLFSRIDVIESERRQAGARKWEVWLAIISGVVALLVAAGGRIFGGKP